MEIFINQYTIITIHTKQSIRYN